jgi:DNA repair protein RadC
MQQSTSNDNAQHQPPMIACGEQPQQRFEAFGAGALSDTELIAIMLHTGIRGHSVHGLRESVEQRVGN